MASNLRAVSLTTILLIAPVTYLCSGESDAPPEYPLWSGEPIEEYARKVGLPATKTVDLGGVVNMEFVLIPAGRFLMGTADPVPPDELYYATQQWVGQLALAIGAGVLLAVLGTVVVRAIRKKGRPQFSLARLLVLTVAAGVALLGGLHWRFTHVRLQEARAEYAAEIRRADARTEADTPAHAEMVARPFYMSKYEVTERQYRQVMGDDPAPAGAEDLPVTAKSKDFLVEAGFRLPSEVEWEFACRAGTRSMFSSGDTEPDLDRVAWYKTNSKGVLHPVGQKAPNAFGLHDMHGNAWERTTRGLWDRNGRVPVNDSVEWAFYLTCSERGGSIHNSPRQCRSANRSGRRTDEPYGLRAVMDVNDAPRVLAPASESDFREGLRNWNDQLRTGRLVGPVFGMLEPNTQPRRPCSAICQVSEEERRGWDGYGLSSESGQEKYLWQSLDHLRTRNIVPLHASDVSVELLKWTLHWDKDGGWHTRRMGAQECADIEQAALALLMLKGYGATEKVGRSKFGVRRAGLYLKRLQRDDGAIRYNHWEHVDGLTHAVATLALQELAYHNKAEHAEAADRALRFAFEHLRCPETGGFRRTPDVPADLLTTTFVVMATIPSRSHGFTVPADVEKGIRGFLQKVECDDVRYSFVPGGEPCLQATLLGLAAQMYLGASKETLRPQVERAVKELGLPNVANANTDLLSQFFASLLVQQQGGALSKEWFTAAGRFLKDMVQQSRLECWDVRHYWAGGGTVLTFSLAGLSSFACYGHYLAIFKEECWPGGRASESR